MAKSAGVEIEEIPEDAVKTPLQRAVQLLKRHRDISYEGHPDDKPISIIITTLAARAYGNEGDVYSALRSIVSRMHEFIVRKDGRASVPNPTNPDENFADKWETHPERAEQFVAWLGSVHADLDAALGQQGLDKVATVLAKGFGHTIVDGAVRRYGGNKLAQRTGGTLRATSSTATLGTAGRIAVRGHTFFGDEE